MSILKSLTVKNLKLNKKRTIVTIIGIILSVALIMAVSTMYNSLISSLIEYEKKQVGNYHVSFNGVSVNELEELKQNRKIEKIFITEDVGYAKVDSKNEEKPYVFIKKFTQESLDNLSVNLVSGRLPQNENEIVIPTHLKTNGRIEYKVGDTVTLDIGKRMSDGYELDQYNSYEENEKLVDTKSKTYKIVGIINRPSSAVEFRGAPGYTFITYMEKPEEKVDAYALYAKEGLKDALGITADIIGMNKANLEKILNGDFTKEESDKLFKEYEKAKYKCNFNNYLIELETDPLQVSGVNEIGVVVAIICAIIIVTSVFCIKNSFDISITEKVKQYGMLRSVGATKKQIRKNVFYEAVILGLIGIPLGIILGIIASIILVVVCNILLPSLNSENLRLVFGISIYPFIISIILGTVTIYLSALRSAIKASKVSPIESIRNSAQIKIKSKKLKTPKLINKIFGIGGVMSYKNIKRNRKKYRTTIISIIVSVSIFIALSSFMTLAFSEVKSELKMKDYNLYLRIDRDDEEAYDKALKIKNFDYIKNISMVRSTYADIENAKYTKEKVEDPTIDIYALGIDQYKKYVKSLNLNYEDVKDKGIFVNTYLDEKVDNGKVVKNLIKRYDYKEQDNMEIKYSDDSKDTITIYKVTDQNPFGLKDIPNEKLIVSDEMYDKLKNESLELNIMIDSDNPDKLQDIIDEQLKDHEYYLNNINENAKMMNNVFVLVAIFLYGFIIVISLIGVTNIYNTITTNMQLRQMEFANLKSLGMTNKEFNRMIRLETLFIGLKSLLFGIPIGLMLSYLIYLALGKNSGLTYTLPLLAILISVVCVFILIGTLMKYSIKKFNKQNIIETIRNENI